MTDLPAHRPVDAELLGRVLDEHGRALALYAAQWTDAADDCVQEALVELARQPAAPAHLVGWMYRVVKHRALNAARGARRRKTRESRVMAERFAAAQSSRGFDHDDTLAVVEALERLAIEDRETIVMRIWGGLKYEEIAEALGISISSAHRQYVKSLESLRVLLEASCSTNENQTNSN